MLNFINWILNKGKRSILLKKQEEITQYDMFIIITKMLVNKPLFLWIRLINLPFFWMLSTITLEGLDIIYWIRKYPLVGIAFIVLELKFFSSNLFCWIQKTRKITYKLRLKEIVRVFLNCACSYILSIYPSQIEMKS